MNKVPPHNQGQRFIGLSAVITPLNLTQNGIQRPQPLNLNAFVIPNNIVNPQLELQPIIEQQPAEAIVQNPRLLMPNDLNPNPRWQLQPRISFQNNNNNNNAPR